VRFQELLPKTRDEIEGYLQILIAGQTPSNETPGTGIPSGLLIKKKS
jgi:hypothetical protein